mgnify:CR=1 FL=1
MKNNHKQLRIPPKKKQKQKKRDWTLTTKFCFCRHGPENNGVVASFPSLGQSKSGSDFSKH